MESRTRHCPACLRSGFTETGFYSHLRLSRNPLCDALYQELMGISLHDEDEEYEEATESDTGNNPIPFSGDAFGNLVDYTDDDFGQVQQPILDREEDGDDEHEEDSNYDEPETGWEPERPGAHSASQVDSAVVHEDLTVTTNAHVESGTVHRSQAEKRADANAFITRYSDKYPAQHAGAAVMQTEPNDIYYCATVDGLTKAWAPFTSKLDWDIAKWAKLRGAGSTAFSDLLAIDGVIGQFRLTQVCYIANKLMQVHEALGLSYKNSNELNKIIDQHLPGRPAFSHHEVIVGGEAFEFFSHNVIECIRALWGDVDFAEHLIVEPERHYVDLDHTIRRFSDMHTGKWWWCTQVCLHMPI